MQKHMMQQLSWVISTLKRQMNIKHGLELVTTFVMVHKNMVKSLLLLEIQMVTIQTNHQFLLITSLFQAI